MPWLLLGKRMETRREGKKERAEQRRRGAIPGRKTSLMGAHRRAIQGRLRSGLWRKLDLV